MKRVLYLFVVLGIVALMVMPLMSCSNMRKAAYRMTHDTSAVDPDTLPGITLTYKKDNTKITHVIDLVYDEQSDMIYYVRRLNNNYLKGSVCYSDVTISTPEGYLIYNNEWLYVDKRTNKSYLVNQDEYFNIEISGEDLKK